MEFAYAKHLQLLTAGKRLHAQTETLKDLAIGVECFKEEYDAVVAAATLQDEERKKRVEEEGGIYDFDE
jgi:hypothetical protein